MPINTGPVTLSKVLLKLLSKLPALSTQF